MDKWLSSFKSKHKETDKNKQKDSPAPIDIEKPGCSYQNEGSPIYPAPTHSHIMSDNGDTNNMNDPTTSAKKKIKMEKASKYEKKKTFNSSWKSVPEFMNWLEKSTKQPSSEGNEYAYCKVCDCDIVAHKSVLLKHSTSDRHKLNWTKVTSNIKLTELYKPNADDLAVKTAELKLCALLASNNLPFLLVDTLTPLIQNIFPDSKIAKQLHLKRTKATSIICNNLGNNFLEELYIKLREPGCFFSLVMDETTDISIKKQCAFTTIIYENNSTKTQFFDLVEAQGSTANDLYGILKNCLTSKNIPLTNFVGFSSDTTNVMVGEFNSVFSKLKEEFPHIICIRCSCHMAHLATSKACLKLPRHVEDLLRNIGSHFNRSALRRHKFIEFQNFFQVKIHKILSPAITRWLSIKECVDRVLEQYEPLRAYLTEYVFEDPSITTETMLETMSNLFTPVYLEFMSYSLGLMTDFNLLFQSEKPLLCKVKPQTETLLRTLCSNFIKMSVIKRTNDIFILNHENPTNFELDNEWRRHALLDFEKLNLNSDDCEQYWSQIFNLKNDANAFLFPNLKKTLQLLFVLPFSNASVERSCIAKFVKIHVGHKSKLTHMTLTKHEKEEIAKKIAQKIPFNNILDDIRDSVIDLNLKRIHLTTKKDLFNIEHSYQLAHPPTWHKNDAISIEAWVNSMKEQGECVLFYKPQGVYYKDYPQLKNDDFVLVIMTPSQVELLKKFGGNIICLDGTHGTNSYDFELHTIMVVDEIREGFPCGFLISNRSDHEVLVLFFSEIMKQTGIIKCKAFMSDMAEAYFNAWLQTMGAPDKRLYCTWHVDKAWRKNINSKIISKKTRALVYKQLRVLLQERDEKAFERMIIKFLHDQSQNSDMSEFFQYFKQYSKNPQVWACCYRKHIGINTNMRLERLHRALKYEYLNGKKVKRLDKSILAIMRLVRDKLFQKIISEHKGKLCTTISNIRVKHNESDKIDGNLIIRTDDTFTVPSMSSTEVYYIHRDVESCMCTLKCEDCGICVHQFYCTCMDSSIKFNMCKHIHAVAQLLNRVDTSQETNLNPEEDNNLIIENNAAPEVATILNELSKKQVASEETNLKKRQDILIEKLTTLIRSTESIEELESLETITSSMTPTMAAVRDSLKNDKTLVVKSVSKGNIVPQRRLFSTKKKKNKTSVILPQQKENNEIAMNLLI
ncbi:unnamed protein product [Diabrotica balteata]|uniref:MULE transposase domain-containing protein n=1 Tax=Diabrotica balteata TaxID=107213 RepID=A0A9N9XIG6_DIABA|nr:unnamed protein product [Diabrotica balteata]